jgi:hydrogenase maturation protein HypF
MAADIESIGNICFVERMEQALLRSSSNPIVILRKREPSSLSEQVAPGQRFLGVMLAYTPLHRLLLEKTDDVLVMTSGNLSEAPICRANEEALRRLDGIADYFLVHNREIHVRCDDSVTRIIGGRPLIVRRARGFAPKPISLSRPFAMPVLACGAQLKNTFCLAKDRYAFVSQHIGDLENYETFAAFVETVEHFKQLFDIAPAIVAHDLHPQYLSTRYALGLGGVRRVAVQHHHAHIVSCMAEHGLDGPVIGVALDGLGYGADGAIWGGEFLLSRRSSYRRRAHFRYVALAGGDTAIRQPWRSALAYLLDAGRHDPISLGLPGWDGINASNIQIVQTMIRQRINTVPTSSCGRLFDAVASIIGLRHEVNYEGQAAVELEMACQPGIESSYSFDVHQGPCHEIDFRPTIMSIVHEMEQKQPLGALAAKFHNTIVSVIVDMCRRLHDSEGIKLVCLSGGTFQNIYLLERVVPRLESFGFEVFRNLEVPPNDGGIALGQAVIADAILKQGK